MALDFETRSRVDLKTHGTDVYASDPSTDIICCSFINKDNNQYWLWYAGTKVPADLIMALNLAVEVEAHNARFDQLIYEYIAVSDYGFPPLKKEKWVCTSAQCRVNALPASLDGATRAINAKYRKDRSGAALIRKLCIPDKKTGRFNKTPALIQQLGKYCMSDSVAMVNMVSSLREMTDVDKRDWQANERINDRGILVDLELAILAQKYAADEKEALGNQLTQLTDGAITSVTQTRRFLDVLVKAFKDQPDILDLMVKVQKDPDAPVKYTLDKSARGQLLGCDIGPHYREVLELIDQGGKSSVSKFSAMINRADPETHRVHGAFIFAGAGQTQRYSSKGLQLHNMKRDCYDAKHTEDIKGLMQRGLALPNVMDTLAKLLRPAIIPAKGHKFVVGDWSAIEARVLPWLSKSESGNEVLKVFKAGEDIYMKTAESMGLTDRQVGKVSVLSMGYGGGVGAFQSMAKNYGLNIPDDEANVYKKQWRVANPWAPMFWSQLEIASLKALRNPETLYEAGRIGFCFIPELLGGTLTCILPNDTFIQYPYAKIKDDCVTAMKASVQPKADSDDEWPRMSLWGGFLAENVTQATAACLLRELIADMVADDFPIVGHCHDEIILEVLDSEVPKTLIECQEYMEAAPKWCKSLPLKAIPQVFERYGK